MKAKDFELTNERTINKMGMATLSHTSEEIRYLEKIFQQELENCVNMSKIEKLFSTKGTINLITADTNAGKTYAIINTFKTSYKNPCSKKARYVKYINVLAVPTRAQAEQIEKEYQVKSIVANVKISKKHDFVNNNIFCILPDTASIMLIALKRLPQHVHINLCVDEAHMLYLEARGYRSEALEQLDQLIQYVKERNGSVVHMTATPDALIGHQFNTYTHFINENPTPVAKKLEFLQSGAKTKAHLLNDLVDFIYILNP